MVGFDWKGDDWQLLPTGGDHLQSLFDPNVENAFKTGNAYSNFIHDKALNFVHGDPTHLNLMAHSLGNMVMFEGLRLLERRMPTQKVANNVLAVEAAIPKEAFEPIQPLSYQVGTGDYTALTPNDAITYSNNSNDALSLQRDSWRGWFRQTNAAGQEFDLHDVIVGKMYNSYNENDFSLNAMRLNDWVLHGDHYGRQASRTVYQGGHPGHYETTTVPQGVRDPLGDPNGYRSLAEIPLLLNVRTQATIDIATILLNLNAFEYGNPNNIQAGQTMGAWSFPTTLALGATASNFNNYFTPINAVGTFKWPTSSHGAAFYQGDKKWLEKTGDSSGVDVGSLADDGLQTYDTTYIALGFWYRSIFQNNPVLRSGNQ